MGTHRITIKSDVEMLQKVGTGNQVLMAAKFLTKTNSNQVVTKLTSLASADKARRLQRNLTVDGRYKLENEQVLMTIDDDKTKDYYKRKTTKNSAT